MFELFFLLLPIAAGYGWYMGQRSAQQNFQKDSSRFSREYVDGVSFLLSNQEDKAVDIFLELIKDENDTIEAHLTLGNLFRSRGEVDRAIRIHQALAESTSLNYEQKLLALQQLGLDYMAAGFYDRAEKLFNKLVDENDYKLTALQQLLMIYQTMKEWDKGIDIAEKLVKLGKVEYRMEIAQFHCELALIALTQDEVNKAQAILKKAENINKQCARVSLMFGRIYIEQQSYQQGVDALEKILEQDKELINEALPLIKQGYYHIGREDIWKQFLERCVIEEAGEEAELMLADIIEKEEGKSIAQSYIQQVLNRHPNMRDFSRLINYYIDDAEEGRAKEGLVLLKGIIEQHVDSVADYSCRKCGFTTNTLYWLCPACRHWSTIKPIIYYK